jgi:hypothetical protein
MEGAAADHLVVMGSMDVGWDDLGSWSQLLAAIGATGSGRVVQPNEPARASDADLVVERADGRLTVSAGPRDILSPGPAALLEGAASSRAPVESLVARVSAWEDRS